MARVHADLTDLLDFFRGQRTPMGVARVQMALMEASLAGDGPPLLHPMAFDHAGGVFRPLPHAPLLALVAAARRGAAREDPDWQAARAALAAAHAAAPALAPDPGDPVFTPGQPFQVAGQMRRLRALCRAHGLPLCALFYDAIPLMAPEHCAPELTRDFTENLLALCLQADRIMAISAAAARDFRDWQRRLLPDLDMPVGLMPLDAPLPALAEGEAAALPPPLDDGAPYVLCVSTLESRKHQALVLHAWLTLLRRHGAHAVPRLVLVGRRGFGAEAALRLLEAAPELRAKALWLQEVSDALLARLYGGCLFAVFNSFYEGWGLPVTEALSHGRLVLAPDHSSLREAGGTAALYFAPNSEPDLAALAWRLIRDPAHRAALEAALPGRLALRSWRQVAEELVAQLLAPAPALPDALARVGDGFGARIGFERPAIPPLPALPAPASLRHHLLMEGEGWSAQEDFGVWLTGGGGALRLRVPGGVALRVFLEVAGPPARSETGLRLVPPGGPPGPWHRLVLEAAVRRHLALALPAGPEGELLVEFDTEAAAALPGEDRRLALFLIGLLVAPAEDHALASAYLAGQLGLTPLG